VVVAPPHLDMADAIRPEDLKRLLSRLSELDEGYVVVDSWSSLDDCTLACLDLSQHVVVVTTPQVTALRDVHRFLEVLGLLGYDRDRVLLVLNHSYHRSEVKVADMERALGYPIVQAIDYAPAQVTSSLNRGVPLILGYPDSPAAASIRHLAELIVERTRRRESEEAEAAPAPEKKEKPKKRGLLFQARPATAGGLR
jgi:pilus assembly protein CpaE